MPAATGRRVGGDDRLDADHSVEVVEQEAEHRCLRAGDGHPGGPDPEEVVVVDERGVPDRLGGPALEGRAPGPEVHGVGRHAHPVLQAVDRLRRLDTGIDQEHAGQAEPGQLLAQPILRGPAEDRDVGVDLAGTGLDGVHRFGR